MTTKQVECHSGAFYGERPTAFDWEGRRRVVKEIEARWRIPGGRCFRVRTEDGDVFELCYGEQQDEWDIHQP